MNTLRGTSVRGIILKGWGRGTAGKAGKIASQWDAEAEGPFDIGSALVGVVI